MGSELCSSPFPAFDVHHFLWTLSTDSTNPVVITIEYISTWFSLAGQAPAGPMQLKTSRSRWSMDRPMMISPATKSGYHEDWFVQVRNGHVSLSLTLEIKLRCICTGTLCPGKCWPAHESALQEIQDRNICIDARRIKLAVSPYSSSCACEPMCI